MRQALLFKVGCVVCNREGGILSWRMLHLQLKGGTAVAWDVRGGGDFAKPRQVCSSRTLSECSSIVANTTDLAEVLSFFKRNTVDDLSVKPMPQSKCRRTVACTCVAQPIGNSNQPLLPSNVVPDAVPPKLFSMKLSVSRRIWANSRNIMKSLSRKWPVSKQCCRLKLLTAPASSKARAPSRKSRRKSIVWKLVLPSLSQNWRNRRNWFKNWNPIWMHRRELINNLCRICNNNERCWRGPLLRHRRTGRELMPFQWSLWQMLLLLDTPSPQRPWLNIEPKLRG
mmetsp:Transcript_24858/g.49580  ORF Transcript_24858/g.49580 Transcript_24858/m.49580 type:complete len:283 (+) Transcript_24858:2014-2862(+)